ncbi:MAG: SDR family NAD(P)-dependent oxidoreductase [Chroococcidiopsidaceae cyanobacterium CP_BM_RX_35]|nr:SDR family NAD(P)-dependent oxidoreductase [Chroococcidiopsidaceae cyanobacterium CP_BM_RX_35]
MGKPLEGKVAIITGAGTGIGEAVAHKFALEGAHVVVNGLPDDPVEDVVSSIRSTGGEAFAHPADISQEAQAIACVQAAVDQFGRLDVLVNNAAINLALSETQNYPLNEFDRLIAANS